MNGCRKCGNPEKRFHHALCAPCTRDWYEAQAALAKEGGR